MATRWSMAILPKPVLWLTSMPARLPLNVRNYASELGLDFATGQSKRGMSGQEGAI
jgi:hypothetical protein